MLGPSAILSPSQLGKEFEEIIREHTRLAELAAYTAGHRAIAEVVREIKATPQKVIRKQGGPASKGHKMPAPEDTGELARSGYVQRVPDGAIIDFAAPQALYMEAGTRPHVAPMAPLRAWAKRKSRGVSLAKLRPKKHGPKLPKKHGPALPPKHGPKKQVASSVKLERQQRRAAAQAAARKKYADDLAKRAWLSIRKYGTEARGFFARASQRFPTIFQEEILKRIAKIK